MEEMQDDSVPVTSVANLAPSQWHRLKDVLANALEENSPERRSTTLREFCADDTTLLRQAETLLAGDTDTLEQFAEFATTRLRSEEPDRIGERVGAYVIVRELGRGGMGAVYLADRADGQFEKQVAIKILKRGTDTDEVLRRFAVERQILAKLDHPNITRLLDAGTTQDNLPYFVMDYVDGVAITEFAQQQNLPLAERLRLILKICSAVEFAHRNDVIHRDIKPTNILVKSNGEPKLLDFGIAKLLQPGMADDLTRPIERRITPRYAAPEQSRDELVTLTADVYSLGLVLFELVTDDKITSETRPDIKTLFLPKLCDRVDLALAGIIKRATRREPARRYASVAELCHALERFLAGAGTDNRAKTFHRLPADRTTAAGAPSVGARWWVFGAILIGVVLAAAGLLRNRGALPFRLHRNTQLPTSTPPTFDAGRLIAVLPFKPIGRDIDDELLGLGMADAVIGQMSKVKGIRVLPTSAVLKLDGNTNDPLTAARVLKADAVLTGTVQRSGDRIRVTIQLVDGRNGRALWSDKFDETFTNVFAVQDSISDEITKALAIDVTADERKQIAKRYTKSIDAYNAYLMGLHFYNKRTKEGLEKAIDYFHQATQRDPEYALAYALLADCYFLQGYYKFVPMNDAISNCKAAADRALALDDSVAEAHVAMAAVQFENRNGEAGMQSLRQALALNPSLAVAHQRYAWELCDMGKLPEALSEMKRAQELDPMSATNNTALGIMFAFNRQFDETLRYCHRANELEPGNPAIQENLGYAYAWNGMYEPAIQAYHKAIEIAPEEKGTALTSIAAILYMANRSSEADSLMPEVTRMAGEGTVDAYSMAILYATARQLDQAFEWLGKALQDQIVTVPFLRYGPELDPLRLDSRFGQLLRKHGQNKLADELSAQSSGPTQTQPKSSSSGAGRLIAVLPFKPLGGKTDDESLGLSMADAVIGQMSKIKEIRVLPTSAVLRLKGEADDPLAAARTLRADAVLTGSVQRSADRIRTSVQLVDGRTGRALWSDKFDETFTNVFAIQDSISSQITKALAIDLTADQRKQITKRYTKSTDAYNAYLMGLHFYNKRTKEGLEKAIDYFHQATQRDPEYALAYALLADCYYLQGYYAFVPSRDATNNCKAAAERALLLDDSVAEAHVALAMVQFQERNGRDAMQSLRRALELNPNLPLPHQRYAWVLLDMGKLREAVSEMKRAQELDPIFAANNTALGVMLAFDRQFTEALDYCYRAAELEPENPVMRENLGFAYCCNGMYEPAIQAAHKFIELAPNQKGDGLASIAMILYVANRKAEANARMPEVLRLAGEGKVTAYAMTLVYAAAGQLDQGIEWFDKALTKEMVLPRFIRYDPQLDPLRTDPRFSQLLRKHGREKLADELSVH